MTPLLSSTPTCPKNWTPRPTFDVRELPRRGLVQRLAVLRRSRRLRPSGTAGYASADSNLPQSRPRRRTRCRSDASREGPPLPGRHQHLRQLQLATDLQVRFQRGAADLVANLSEHLQRHIRTAGFQCSALVASEAWPPTAAATCDDRPELPPTSSATSAARTATRHRAPGADQRHLPNGRPAAPPRPKPSEKNAIDCASPTLAPMMTSRRSASPKPRNVLPLCRRRAQRGCRYERRVGRP